MFCSCYLFLFSREKGKIVLKLICYSNKREYLMFLAFLNFIVEVTLFKISSHSPISIKTKNNFRFQDFLNLFFFFFFHFFKNKNYFTSFSFKENLYSHIMLRKNCFFVCFVHYNATGSGHKYINYLFSTQLITII